VIVKSGIQLFSRLSTYRKQLTYPLGAQKIETSEGSPTLVQGEMEENEDQRVEDPSEGEVWDCVHRTHKLSVARSPELKDSMYFGNVCIKLLVAGDLRE
jgi:hypothetical protein